MEYTINLSADGSYILCAVIGEITAKQMIQIDIEAHALGRKLNINKFLLDMAQCRNVDSAVSNYQFAYKDLNIPEIDRLARVAVFLSPEDHSHDFIETVLVNTGMDVAFFRDRKMAELFIN